MSCGIYATVSRRFIDKAGYPGYKLKEYYTKKLPKWDSEIDYIFFVEKGSGGAVRLAASVLDLTILKTHEAFMECSQEVEADFLDAYLGGVDYVCRIRFGVTDTILDGTWNIEHTPQGWKYAPMVEKRKTTKETLKITSLCLG